MTRFGFYMKLKKDQNLVLVRITIANSIAQTLIDALNDVPVEKSELKTTVKALCTEIEFTTPDIDWAHKLHYIALRIYRQNSGIGDICLN